MIITSLFLAAFVTKVTAQALMIINQTSCAVNIILFARDNCSSTGCASYQSVQFAVAASSSITFTDPTDVNVFLCRLQGPALAGKVDVIHQVVCQLLRHGAGMALM